MTTTPTTTTTTIHLHVTGMMCQRNCGTTVATALQRLDGAVEAQAVFAQERAWVTFHHHHHHHGGGGASAGSADRDKLWTQQAVDAVECVGFDATPIYNLEQYLQQLQQEQEQRLDVHVTGMMCQQNCATTVQRALEHVPGVTRVQVSFAEQRATVWGIQQQVLVQQAAVMDAIQAVGFEAQPWKNEVTTQGGCGVDKNNSNNSNSNNTPQGQHHDTSTNSNNNNNNNTFTLSIEGMSCAVCTGRVEAAILTVPGVAQATVVLSTQRATVTAADNQEYDNDQSWLPPNNSNHHHHHHHHIAQACLQAVTQAGYTCRMVAHDVSLQENAQQLAASRARERNEWQRLFTASCAALIPIAIVHYGHLHNTIWSMALVFVLSTAVQFGVGKRFYKAAYAGWTHGRTLGMDFLICLGTTASYVYSVVIVALHVLMLMLANNNWDKQALKPTFMTGVMLLTFVSLGKWLEAIAKGNTCSAIQSLMEMQPATAWRIVQPPQTFDQLDWGALQTVQVPSTDIVPGDVVKVLPGERLPADGMLVAMTSSSAAAAAQAFVDESSFSGEPFAVSKQVGDVVLGGTVNQSTVLLLQVTAAGRDSWLAKIVQLVEDAQRHKAPIQVYADRVAAVFAPIVVAIAAVTLVFWLVIPNNNDEHEEEMWEERVFVAIMSAISVVVVACPCALGLGTSAKTKQKSGLDLCV